jgi:hypothetical protein
MILLTEDADIDQIKRFKDILIIMYQHIHRYLTCINKYLTFIYHSISI